MQKVTFKKFGSRYKVKSPMGVTIGWIQEFYYFGTQPPKWVYCQSPSAFLLQHDDLLTIAGFISAITEAQPLEAN
jgi:hypothetical protein